MFLELHYAVVSSMITNELATSAMPHAPVVAEPIPAVRRRRWPRWRGGSGRHR
jgi:hypothetical protein